MGSTKYTPFLTCIPVISDDLKSKHAVHKVLHNTYEFPLNF